MLKLKCIKPIYKYLSAGESYEVCSIKHFYDEYNVTCIIAEDNTHFRFSHTDSDVFHTIFDYFYIESIEELSKLLLLI